MLRVMFVPSIILRRLMVTVFEKEDSYKIESIPEIVVIVVNDIELPTLQSEGSLTIEG